MSILADWEIRAFAETRGMIDPFDEGDSKPGIISYGLSSYGYDIRIADEFQIFTDVYGQVVDPKDFSPKSMIEYKGNICTIPPNSFAPHQVKIVMSRINNPTITKTMKSISI